MDNGKSQSVPKTESDSLHHLLLAKLLQKGKEKKITLISMGLKL